MWLTIGSLIFTAGAIHPSLWMPFVILLNIGLLYLARFFAQWEGGIRMRRRMLAEGYQAQ
jgi:hypothetical protein